jgi:WD40 repeat protein
MIQAEVQDMQSLTKLLDCVTDLEIVHACICIDVYITLTNLANLENHTNMCSNLNEKILEKIKTLISIIRKFIYILKDIPQSFLQHVVDEKHEKLSSEATVLLMTRYRGLAYFDSEDDEENIKSALIGRIFTNDRVLDVDISPSEDFLICAYSEGVELFSLSTFKSLWKIDEFVVEMIYHPPADLAGIYYGIPPSIVFHPFKNVIFPGQLDRVFNLEGKFEPGPLTVEETNCKFTNCGFSHDKSKMATNYGNYLTVWNLLDNNKIARLSCRSKLYSILFSANDRFLATTNADELCIYDTENSYCMTSRIYDVLDDPPFLISPYNSDSWYCGGEIVKYDLTRKPVSKRYKLLPKNARAAAEFQAFIESDDPRRFHTKNYLNIFVLRNRVALAYWCYQHDLNMLSVTDLIQDFTLMQKSGEDSFSRCSISVDGRYIYKSSQHNTLGVPYGSFDIWMLSCTQCLKYKNVCQFKHAFTPFVPVTDGIFFCGEVSEHIGYDSELFESTPELWNSEVTERLFSFPELTGTFKCLSVGEDVIACVLKSQVCFFNVRTKKIVASIPLTKYRFRSVPYPFESKVEVIACSSQYHVLMKNNKDTLLLQGENIVDLNPCVNNLQPLPILGLITSACFSPNGQLLAFATSGKRENRLYILDTSTLKIICEFPLYSPVSQMQLHFLDNELLLCKRYISCLCLISIKTCDVLTCINVGLSDIPWIFSVSRKTGEIIVYSTNYVKDKEFKLIKLWLPHERKDVNELQCSCSIDAEGGTDSLIDMYSFQAAEIYSSIVSSCSIM